MPEIKQTFTKGRMNLDLDERLLPPNEYREALNIQVSSAEGSDIGSVKNILGNTEIKTDANSTADPQGTITIPDNYTCIGSIADEKNNSAYYFIVKSDNGASAIMQYKDNEINPLLIDSNNSVLEFDKEVYITGINVIDDFLFFTDGVHEPKKINIKSFEENTNTSFTTTSNFYVNSTNVGEVKKENITVIKKKPTLAPKVTLEKLNDAFVSGVIDAAVTILDTNTNSTVDLTISNNTSIKVGDILLLSDPAEPGVLPENAQIRSKVQTITGSTVTCLILSVASSVSTSSIAFEFQVEDLETLLFSKDFPRFSYRYKYQDGEYSAFAPFTQVGFEANEFSYRPTAEPFNTGMETRVKKITLTDFVTKDIPVDVVEIDLLYKSESSPVIYSIDTIKPKKADGTTDNPAWTTIDGTNSDVTLSDGTTKKDLSNTGFYEITSDLIYAVLPENQLLRVYDNVPKKAKAQEFTANRLIYGNYVQNLNLGSYDNNIILGFENRTFSDENIDFTFGKKSIKSLRTYQAGIVFLDQYCRETPVFTSNSASLDVTDNDLILNSSKSNRLTLENIPTLTNSDAVYFKTYIKETSNEYYNLVVDRVYKADIDSNLWISFPSSERNKLQEDDFIILKKSLDNNSQVRALDNKFKVIDIQNEAPEFIRKKYVLIGTVDGQGTLANLYSQSSAQPAQGLNTIIIDKDQFLLEGLNDIQKLFDDNFKVHVTFSIPDLTSSRYEIIALSTEDSNPQFYKITFDRNIELKDAWVETSAGVLATTLKTTFWKEEIKNWEEFQGRFFVKINSNSTTREFLESQIGANILANIVSRNKVFSLRDKNLFSLNSVMFQQSASGDNTSTDPNRQGGFTNTPTFNLNNWKLSNILTFDTSPVARASNWFLDEVFTIAQQPTVTSDYNISGIKKQLAGAGGGTINLLRQLPAGAPQPASQSFEFDVSCSGNLFKGSAFNLVHSTTNITNNTSPITFVTNNDDLDENDGGFVNGLEGIITTDTYHTKYARSFLNSSEYITILNASGISGVLLASQTRMKENGPKAWKKQVGRWSTSGVGERVYGENGSTGKFFMHLSFSTVGEDLHDGSDLRFGGESETAYGSSVITLNGVSRGGSKWASNVGGTSVIDLQSIENFNCQFQVHKRVCDLPQRGPSSPKYDLNKIQRQWDPTFGKPENIDIVKNLVAGNKFRFKSDTNKTTFTIKSVTIKRLYNHTSWNRSVVLDPNDLTKVKENVQSVHHAWWKYKLGLDATTLAVGGSSTANMRANFNNLRFKIRDFGAAHNRRVCYILELDKDPSDLCSVDPESLNLGTADFIEFIENFSLENSTVLSDNPAVFETEPKDNVDLDLYYETTNAIPLTLTKEYGHMIGPIGSAVRCSDNNAHLSTPNFKDCIVADWDVDGGDVEVTLDPGLDHLSSTTFDQTQATTDFNGLKLKFFKDDLSYVEYEIKSVTSFTATDANGDGVNDSGIITKLTLKPKPTKIGLEYFNCFSFNNGVESNRIKDDFNKPFIKNGVKASSVIQQQYKEDNRTNGLIYSGIYNKNTNTNNLNQFIQAEKITKDLLPTYGSIQKLYTRDNDLIAFCEDKVVQILADKDILFNADGNPQLTASNKVLGQARPFVGDYGISKNPESFAKESYRAYFTDKQRGAVLRLSMDGLTAISDAGMKNFFGDKLEGNYSFIIGSYDNDKSNYNITFKTSGDYDSAKSFDNTTNSITVSYKESVRGWESFKSYIPESGLSIASTYYTFKNGKIYSHNNEIRNYFYDEKDDNDDNLISESFVNTLFNQEPTTVKSFKTLNYDGDTGWKCSEITTDLNSVTVSDFINKENRYYAYIKGGSKINQSEFNFQGIGFSNTIKNIT